MIGELFTVEGTTTTRPENLVKNGRVPRVTCSSTNNGLDDVYNNEATERGHVITIDSATIGFTAYHDYDFIATDHVEKLTLCSRFMSRYLGLSLVTAIRCATRQKYNYGYKFSQDRIRRQTIFLPVDDDGLPDWNFMEGYMRKCERTMIEEYISRIRVNDEAGEILSLDGVKWAKFRIGDLFRLEQGKGRGANHLESISDGISYLGATNRNNAVLDFVKPVEKLVQKGNCIAFIRNGEGAMGYSVYKSEDFIATGDITVGYAPFLNRYTGIFITTAADMVRGRYSYNYKRSDTRLKNEIIQLPANDSGDPDWQFMEDYMRQTEQTLLRKYISHITAMYPEIFPANHNPA